MTQVTVFIEQAQVVVGEETPEVVVSPSSPVLLEIWQPGVPPGKNNNDVLSWNDGADRWESSDRLTLLEARMTALENQNVFLLEDN